MGRDDGLMFLYFNNNTKDDGQIFAQFSNSSSSYSCFTQPVNRNNGKLSGQAVTCTTNSSIEEEEEAIFVYNAALGGGKGVIGLGYPTKVVANHFSHLDFYNGDFHLATREGRVLVESKINGGRIHVRNGTVSVEEEMTGTFHSCKSDNGGLTNFRVKIRGSRRIFYCSSLEIGGVESV